MPSPVEPDGRMKLTPARRRRVVAAEDRPTTAPRRSTRASRRWAVDGNGRAAHTIHLADEQVVILAPFDAISDGIARHRRHSLPVCGPHRCALGEAPMAAVSIVLSNTGAA